MLKSLLGDFFNQLKLFFRSDLLREVRVISAKELSSSFKSSNNGGSYDRLSDTFIENSIFVNEIIKNAKKTSIEPCQFGVAKIDNAVVSGEGIVWKKIRNEIYVVSETLISSSFSRNSIFPLMYRNDVLCVILSKIREILPRQHMYAFLRQTYDGNYGHWIIDVLPKVAILAEHFDLRDLRFIISRLSGPMQKVYVDSLKAFGIESHQIVFVTRMPIQVETLLYPLPISMHPWVKSPRIVKILEDLRDEILVKYYDYRSPERIYISRKMASKRHLLNECDLFPILEKYQIDIVYPEKLSFIEQVVLFSKAKIVIGNCGANLANVVFSPQGVTLFSITSEVMIDDFFWDLINLKSGKYFSLHGRADCLNPDMNSNFLIDCDEFRSLLEEKVLSS